MITFKFGKFTGQTLEEVASQEKGRQWLDWLVSQPVEGKFAAQNKKRNEEIIAYLSEPKDVVRKNEPKESQKKEPNEDLTAFQVIINKLDVIEGLLRGMK